MRRFGLLCPKMVACSYWGLDRLCGCLWISMFIYRNCEPHSGHIWHLRDSPSTQVPTPEAQMNASVRQGTRGSTCATCIVAHGHEYSLHPDMFTAFNSHIFCV